MKKMISLLLCAMMAVICSALASCTYGDQESEEWWQSDARREADEEYERDWATKPPKPTEKPTEEPSFIETICGTYLVSGSSHLSGNEWYDEDLTSQEATHTNLALHVSQVDENTVAIDLDGGLQGSGTISAESPAVSYTVEDDEWGHCYQITVTFTVKDGVAQVDYSYHEDIMNIFGEFDSTEDMKLSGEK